MLKEDKICKIYIGCVVSLILKKKKKTNRKGKHMTKGYQQTYPTIHKNALLGGQEFKVDMNQKI